MATPKTFYIKRSSGLRPYRLSSMRMTRARNDQQTTRWYKGTVISYSRNGYVITFDGCGPDENELVKSLKQGVEKGEIKVL